MQTTYWMAAIGFALCAGLWVLARRRRGKLQPTAARRRIVVDGTNVMFWHDNTAKLSTLKSVVGALRRRNLDPVVFLDASSRHHLGDRSLDAVKFARVLGLRADRVVVCPARTEADAFLLDYARRNRLAVVSNDRFRDRPRAARNLRLVGGYVANGRVRLKGL
ncbi:NYN domain-containing protein [Sulfitobacter sp. S190]|uniref:NYN domain-containing protein n=1 Tax=Sulfitobacter sp. S190 TaxID=2867022 RepID=UPI0021A27E8D|nr:hypothetical protein [Sulfitobacter sp. S190]UWR22346.1 hypothetical protein K3756_17055 [Sulfitobacter sp. S190]